MNPNSASIPNRLARTLCPSDYSDCPTLCSRCTNAARSFTRELAAILRERYGHSETAEWLDSLYPHNP